MKTIIQATTTFFLLLASSVMGQDLPTADEVKSVTIKFDRPKLGNAEFDCMPGDWDAIRSQLLPAKEDAKPSKWKGMGTVKIKKKDGQPFHIELYSTGSGPGAFSAGKTYEEPTYFRGGDSSGLSKAVRVAYENSRKNSSHKTDSFYSPIMDVGGWAAKRLKDEAGITVKKVSPNQIGISFAEEKHGEEANLIGIAFDCSKLGKDQIVRMNLQVIGQDRRSISLHHAESKGGDGNELEMTFHVNGSALEHSYLTILISKPPTKDDGSISFGGYSLDVRHAVQLAGKDAPDKAIEK